MRRWVRIEEAADHMGIAVGKFRSDVAPFIPYVDTRNEAESRKDNSVHIYDLLDLDDFMINHKVFPKTYENEH